MRSPSVVLKAVGARAPGHSKLLGSFRRDQTCAQAWAVYEHKCVRRNAGCYRDRLLRAERIVVGKTGRGCSEDYGIKSAASWTS